MSSHVIGSCTPSKTFAAAPEAATPDKNRSESPGKISPTKSPVSVKIIAKIPIKPKVEIIEWASRTLTAREESIDAG
jgi:hypothetical protein